MNNVRIAAAQFGGTTDKEENLRTIRRLAEQAHDLGAQVTCLPELATTVYFCSESNPQNFDLAEPIPGPAFDRIAEIAVATEQTIVCSIYEQASVGEYYNSSFIVDAAGSLRGLYRKNSIPLSVGDEGVRANEKMYFRPGNLGFPVFDMQESGQFGIMICYDRHFPEGARSLGLKGADVVFIPTASWRSPMKDAWEIELRAHAITNAFFVCGVNKVGLEKGGSPTNSYFGSSLIIDPRGNVLARASDETEDLIVADLDADMLAEHRRLWPVYRDRRPDAYEDLVRP